MSQGLLIPSLLHSEVRATTGLKWILVLEKEVRNIMSTSIKTD